MKAVECLGVTKNYGKKAVVDGINLSLEENKIYGLLGRNGAGKTTLLNIIAALIKEDQGQVKVFEEIVFDNEKILNQICFVTDRMTYMSNLKVSKIFRLAQGFFENWDEEFKNQLIERFKLEENKKYRRLSKGMQALVGIIIGLAARSPLTIFDEAYSGLDAAARESFYKILLKDYIDNPRTIIFSTHLIDEVSNLFEEIIIIDKGKLLLQEDMNTINEKSFEIWGDETEIDKTIIGKRVLKTETVGRSKKAFIFDYIEEEHNIKLKRMSLQDLFINITNE
ncbi:ABC transporter ATP-binding protein [Clostridium sp. 19966]|uniref:ABC transporter ATP-binding protein n=1 Tax=Clostridium sp. 19966 TaxID=2768166 RepID=UPI0028DE71C3|nr:ABC transporter ATP-binding protein [Clostridium sp. 19966]MDT8717931.1 ABC transporter ATP-binding protein [Clostridium sp. 19966]